jgi:threonine synthase
VTERSALFGLQARLHEFTAPVESEIVGLTPQAVESRVTEMKSAANKRQSAEDAVREAQVKVRAANLDTPEALALLEDFPEITGLHRQQEIADAKAVIGSDGIGCEPASAVTVAGIRKLVAAGEIDPGEDIVAILTGHVLKDPDYTVNYHRGTLTYADPTGVRFPITSNYANRFIQVPSDKDALLQALAI